VTGPLPEPTSQRWQPLRIGLVELFHYDAEEFWFAGGRLLLRGNNGTGKSKVLALTLPFLLDGDSSGHRVEPDGDRDKRMEWNLLLGGRHSDRVGYAWIEFGRVADGEAPRYLTLGCGLKAVAGRGIAAKWFFLTHRRMGDGLHLVDRNRLVVERERLREALAGDGDVIDGVEAYRRAVDERLFGLGPERYAALVGLLIQLRQPQLSKRPDEQALSRALTEALPPLGQEVIADVAAAMRNLEQEREQLAELREARRAVGAFADRYREYARIATRRREKAVRSRTYDYEETARELAAAAAGREEALAEQLRLDAELVAAAEETAALTARERTLRSSPEMRDAARLATAAERVERASSGLERAVEAEEAAERTARQRGQARAGSAAALADAREERDRAATAAATAAAAAGIGDQHRDLAGRAGAATHHAPVESTAAGTPPAAVDGAGAARPSDPTDGAGAATDPAAGEGDPAAATGAAAGVPRREDAERLAASRGEAVALVQRRVREVEEAERARAVEARSRDDALRQRDAAADAVTVAEEAAGEAATALVAAVTVFVSQSAVLRLADPAGALAELAAWVDAPEGPNPSAVAAQRAGRDAAARLAAEDERLAAAASAVAEETAAVRTERDGLAAGAQPVPPTPHTRADAGRDGRPGAPLWRLVEFRDGVDDAARAGLEAALEASGLLDAWVTPAGGLLGTDLLDVAVTTGPAAGPSLGAALRPADEGPVATEVVGRLLDGIGLGPATADTWVDVDGRFRLGVAEGRWRKATAAFVGAAAREAARRRRLAELDAELERLAARAEELAAGRRDVAGRRGRLDEELASFPDDAVVRRTAAEAGARRAELRRAGEKLAAASQRLAQATEAAARVAAARDDLAAELGLPPDPAGLADVQEALTRYRLSLAALWPAVAALAAARQRDADAEATLAEAIAALDRAQVQARETRAELTGARAEHDTLAEMVGAAVADVRRRLDETVAALAATEDRRERLRRDAKQAYGRVQAAEARRDLLGAQLDARRADRAAATDALRRLAQVGVVQAAVPEVPLPDPTLPWAADPGVRLARELAQRLGDVDDGDRAWERASSAITASLAELQRALSVAGDSAEGELREDVLVVTARYRQLATAPHLLLPALAEEAERREEILDHREREILENHLVSEVASQLSALVAGAERQVAAMNAELEARPTSTGMRLRLRWVPDVEHGPAGLREARERLLRQAAVMWSPEDREAVGAFLQAEIRRVRAEDEQRTWTEQLARAFDYRRWHRFVIERRQGDGGWRRATGPASGGKRVLAATVPLFAAASSHYTSAAPHAPRLVLLDEAFAGVDDAARRQCMSLLTTFDRDYVLTSEREWGCYPEVPALSICHLVRWDGIDAVHVSRWHWNGRERTPLTTPRDTALAPPPSQPATAAPVLFTDL